MILSEQSVQWLPRIRPDKIWAERKRSGRNERRRNRAKIISLITSFGRLHYYHSAKYEHPQSKNEDQGCITSKTD